jgi:hypothetical protein
MKRRFWRHCATIPVGCCLLCFVGGLTGLFFKCRLYFQSQNCILAYKSQLFRFERFSLVKILGETVLVEELRIFVHRILPRRHYGSQLMGLNAYDRHKKFMQDYGMSRMFSSMSPNLFDSIRIPFRSRNNVRWSTFIR